MFPSTTDHYKELLYGAYKCETPVLYLNEILEPYADTSDQHQLVFLTKTLINRSHLSNTPLMKTILQEEKKSTLSNSPSQLLSRFIYYSTSMCHVWHTGTERNAFTYCLDPVESVIICYFNPNEPLSYIWLDVDVSSGCIRLIKSNITSMVDYSLTTIWKWTDGGDRQPITKMFTYDMHTGNAYEEIDSDTAGGGPVMRVAVSSEDGRVGISQEVGLEHEWPFIIVITYTSEEEYMLSKMLFNSRKGHLHPILTAMHPLLGNK